jgi:6-phosphofructokinase 1
MEVIGIRRGYEGLLEGDGIPLTKSSVGGIIHRGGTILRTARSERFRRPEGVREALTRLAEFDIDGLVVVGGDGSFRGAHRLHELGFPVVGVPGTIDNDIAGTDFTIGFDTACNTALEAVVKLRDTASSHDRLFLVEVMGRSAGFLALEVALASGAEYVLVPEIPFDLEHLNEKLHYARQADQLKDTGGYEARITVLGHIQRGGGPTCSDAVLASRMGAAAVEALATGERGVMIVAVNGAVRTCPLAVAWEEKKPLDLERLRLVETLSI